MSAGYLVDTNVISESLRPAPHAGVLEWLRTQLPLRLASVTVYELSRGVQLAPAGRRRRFLDEWLNALLGGPAEIVPFEKDAAIAAAAIESSARRRGRPVAQRDLFILATASAHGLSVATRDTRDFLGHGVPLFDPFRNIHQRG